MRLVGVIPAAGFATRLPGLEGSKEMMKVRGRPLIEYIVERMRFASPDSIRVVIRPIKTDLIEHAEALGLDVVSAETTSAAHSIAKGAFDLAPDDVVLLGFPDTIWQPIDGFNALVESLSVDVDLALGLFSSSHPERSDVAVLDEAGLVRQIHVKSSAPPSNIIWGCAATRRQAIDGIASFDYPGEHFQRLCASGTVRGVWLSDFYVDFGTPDTITSFEGDSRDFEANPLGPGQIGP